MFSSPSSRRTRAVSGFYPYEQWAERNGRRQVVTCRHAVSALCSERDREHDSEWMGPAGEPGEALAAGKAGQKNGDGRTSTSTSDGLPTKSQNGATC